MTIETMTTREFVAGLMRGDRATLKSGYTAESAAIAVAETKGLDREHQIYDDLLAYANGFARGMSFALGAEYKDASQWASQAFLDGVEDGMREDAERIQPS